MKQLIFITLLFLSVFPGFSTPPIPLNPTTPPPHIGEESMTSMSTSNSSKRITLKTSLNVYYPVSANVDDVALTVLFSQPVGYATVMVYDANNQLLDMVTVDTAFDTEATISTETWAAGSYRLVISYGTTTLVGSFNF